MTLLEFARGPALQASLIIFALGTVWRLVGVVALPWRLIAATPREGAPPAWRCALNAIIAKMWPEAPFSRAFVFINGYVFHIGLAIVFFLFAPHVLFIKSLTGLSWPALPNNVVSLVGMITAASLIAAIWYRATHPVLKLISRLDDYLSSLVTLLPVATGLAASLHWGGRYETLLALHYLSLAAFFVWFPFGKLMHALLFVVSRGVSGVRLGQRGAQV